LSADGVVAFLKTLVHLGFPLLLVITDPVAGDPSEPFDMQPLLASGTVPFLIVLKLVVLLLYLVFDEAFLVLVVLLLYLVFDNAFLVLVRRVGFESGETLYASLSIPG
jgi:hypothetical protein